MTTEQRANLDLSDQIPGWGVDLNPEVRPGVPRDQARMIGADKLYPSFEPQISHLKIFLSSEHRQMTPVFGTTCPPRGLSGLIRSYAYTHSEALLRRWLLLLAADRVDMVEGVIDDLLHLHIPNFPKEMGWKADFKYNRSGVAKAAIAIGAVVFATIAFSKYLDSRRLS